jgi:uncharacterized protein (TIGR00725 family)
MRHVAVVGPGNGATADDIATAREVGALLAQAGAVVLTGGLAGVMAAATVGANEHGGLTVAMLPGEDRAGCPATVAIPTGLGELRNGLLVRAADAVIAVGGSWGTLSEVALAMRTGVRMICLGGWTVEGAEPRPVTAVDAADAVRLALAEPLG